jgi:hypothetical protein
MPGKISRIAVTYTVDTPDGPLHTFHGLPHMREHIQPARLQPLLDELTAICQELIASRPARPGNGLALARRSMPVTGEEATALFQLRCQWQGSYVIALRDGVWSASRYDDPTTILTADTAPELCELMQDGAATHGLRGSS